MVIEEYNTIKPFVNGAFLTALTQLVAVNEQTGVEFGCAETLFSHRIFFFFFSKILHPDVYR